MIVSVRMFALAAQLAGAETVELELPDCATVATLRQRLAQQYPKLADVAGHMMFAVDTQYAADSTKIPPGAQIACIPPVSGG
jgi:molybdopterin converting factor subunit 1